MPSKSAKIPDAPGFSAAPHSHEARSGSTSSAAQLELAGPSEVPFPSDLAGPSCLRDPEDESSASPQAPATRFGPMTKTRFAVERSVAGIGALAGGGTVVSTAAEVRPISWASTSASGVYPGVRT